MRSDYSGDRLCSPAIDVRQGARAALCVALTCAVAIVACSCKPDGQTTEQTRSSKSTPVITAAKHRDGPEPSRTVTLGDDVWHGVCFAHNWQWGGLKGYGSGASAESLEHLESIGVEWISITPFGFMPDLQAATVVGENSRPPPPGAETSKRLRAVVEQAREHQMKVMLKPHIWIRGGKWRGRIKPTSEEGELVWNRWWDSYDDWVLYYARLASELDLEALVIGLELHTAVQHSPDRLIALAEKVRDVYAGHITYSANWNEPVPDDVWRSVDSVGVQFYPPLVKDRDDFTVREIRRSLRKHLDHWNSVARRTERPLVITEVGYRAADIAVRYPNAWPEKMDASEDRALQRLAYETFFEELTATPRLGGVFLWKYFTNADTEEEGPTGFSPRGKPAEAVIRRAFSPREEAAPGPTVREE